MLGLALAAAYVLPLLLVAITYKQQGLSWLKPSMLWLFAAICVAIILLAQSPGDTVRALGLVSITARSLVIALAIVFALAAGSAVVLFVQRRLGLPLGDKATYTRIAEAPLSLRAFAVLTAGVVEELLYRGIGIGVGDLLIGDAALAAVLSVIAFTAAHFRWQVAHLVQVAVAGAILSAAFLLTRDLWACVIAHLLVDALGFIVVPALRKRVAKA